MWCRSPRAAERIGRTSLPAASPATAARAGALPSRPACISFACRDVPTKPPPSASRSGCGNAPESWRDYFYWNVELDARKLTTESLTDARRWAAITSVRPLWAIEGGRVTLEGDGFPIDPVAPQVRVGAQTARLASASAPALTVLIPEGLEGGSTSAPHRRAARRNRVRRDRRAARHRRAPRRQPGLRPPRQSLRHVQRLPRAAGAGLDLHRPAGRHARAVRQRRPEPDVARVRSRRTARTCRAASTAASTASRRTAARRSMRATSASRAGSRSVPTARSSSAIGRAPSCASTSDGRARAFASLPPSVAAFHLAFGPDGHLYVAAPTLGTRDPDLSHRARRRGRRLELRLRPSAGARLRRGRPPVCRRRAGRLQRPLPDPARRAARAGADALGRPAHRPGLRSARRHRARDERDGLQPARRPARAAAATDLDDDLSRCSRR